jgi:anthranilate/para-aminobenzoate synthase component II
LEDNDEVIMALEHKTRPIYGVQFHPESIDTDNGKKLIENFLKAQ